MHHGVAIISSMGSTLGKRTLLVQDKKIRYATRRILLRGRVPHIAVGQVRLIPSEIGHFCKRRRPPTIFSVPHGKKPTPSTQGWRLSCGLTVSPFNSSYRPSQTRPYLGTGTGDLGLRLWE